VNKEANTMLSRPFLQTLQRLHDADQQLAACLDDTDRVPAGRTLTKEALRTVERIRELLTAAREAASLAAEFFLTYERLTRSEPTPSAGLDVRRGTVFIKRSGGENHV
jgi:hypothetical protein